MIIITATNRYVTEPIAKSMGVEELLACEAEIVDDCYTGKPAGIPSYGAGKVTRLQQWLLLQHEDLAGSYFYSDSHNDIPLLSIVDHPIAVDPDDRLRQHARNQGWQIISLRD